MHWLDWLIQEKQRRKVIFELATPIVFITCSSVKQMNFNLDNTQIIQPTKVYTHATLTLHYI